MFIPHCVYTHKNMLDVCFYVQKSYRIPGGGGYSVRVKWYNNRGLDLGLTETIRIRSTKGWKRVN